jgi:hypothetical protein
MDDGEADHKHHGDRDHDAARHSDGKTRNPVLTAHGDDTSRDKGRDKHGGQDTECGHHHRRLHIVRIVGGMSQTLCQHCQMLRAISLSELN